MRSACKESLPPWLTACVSEMRDLVSNDRLPLLTLLQSEPLLMQSSHLSFQEYFCARAVHRGMTLPGEKPWRWTQWFANCLRLGIELGEGFGSGLMRASGAANGQLELIGQIGGHRPTSISAVAQLLLGLHTIDLSQNELTSTEVSVLAKAVAASKTLTALNLAKNNIGDEGAAILAKVVPLSKLVNLNLFCTNLKEEGARSLIPAIEGAPSLTRLNLQYNALRHEVKKELEKANAARVSPLSLVV